MQCRDTEGGLLEANAVDAARVSGTAVPIGNTLKSARARPQEPGVAR